MRFLFVAFLFLALPSASIADTYLYVSKAPEQAIQIYRLNPADGVLAPVATVKVDGAPGSLATDPERKFLFASLRTTSSLASFRIDPATGKLTWLCTVPLEKGANAAYVATDRTGKWLLSASYMGGKVVVHRIDKDGAIVKPAVQVISTVATAHAIATDAGNRFVFVPHVSPNAIYQYRFDAKSGKLEDAGKAEGGSPKAGPRHFSFHPTLPVAFSSDEVGNRITAYAFDAEKGLTPGQTLSTLPEDFKKANTTAEVKVHPSGKFVWVSNRGHDSLAGFAIDKTGKLSALGQTPTENTPRSFEIEPEGRWLFGAGEGSGKLAVFEVDRDSGSLTRRHTVAVGKSLTWVMAVKFGK